MGEINLALHKGTITDGSGTQSSTAADRSGLFDEDNSTNVVEVAAEATFIIDIDFGIAYEISDIRVYASAVDTAYWTIATSQDAISWKDKAVAEGGGGTYVETNVDKPYRYVKITCDATGEAAISLREFIVLSDATKMKFQTGTSGEIGFTSELGGLVTTIGYHVVIDQTYPATEDGYLIGFRGIGCVDYESDLRLAIFRSVGDDWYVFSCKSSGWVSGGFVYNDIVVLDEPLRFRAGDFIGARLRCNPTTNKGFMVRSEVGMSYEYWANSTDIAHRDLIPKSNFATVGGKVLCFNSMTNQDIPNMQASSIPLTDRSAYGVAGISTDPRVWNLSDAGANPEIDFWPYLSSLVSNIGAGVTDIVLHDASNFNPGESGYASGGRVQIGDEKIDYEYVNTNTLTNCTRGVGGTAAAAHSAFDRVTDITPYIQLSVDNAAFYDPNAAALPLSLGATIGSAQTKVFYLRTDLPSDCSPNITLKHRLAALWTV